MTARKVFTIDLAAQVEQFVDIQITFGVQKTYLYHMMSP